MHNFSEDFARAEGQPIQYKGNTLLMQDDVSFEDGDRFVIKFEKTTSPWIQGIGLSLFGIIEIEALKIKVKNRTVFWHNTAPNEIYIKVWQDNSNRKKPKNLPPRGILGIKNIWDSGMGAIESWYGGSAMIVENIANGKRYYCNDGHLDENFDDIVFTIQKIAL